MAVIVNSPGSALTYETREAISAIVRSLYLCIIDTTAAAVGTAGAYHYVTPLAGTITSFRTVLNGAITTDDAVLTLATNQTGSFVNVTNGAVTIANASSAAGDVDTATPTAANSVDAGNTIRVTDNAAAGGTSTAGMTIVIRLDREIQNG